MVRLRISLASAWTQAELSTGLRPYHFHREARAAAGVTHENVVTIHHVGCIEERDLSFLVMQFVRGRSLQERLDENGALPIREAVRIGAATAAGLAAAHANNLIHRDVLVPNGATFLAKRGDEGCEFLASTDNWFRPVFLSIGPDGAVYVLESDALTGATPLLRSFDLGGREHVEIRLAERTASAVRIGPAGPVSLQYPAAEWMPSAAGMTRAAQRAHARPGHPVAGGDEVVVYRQGNEVRIALVGPAGVRRGWRILSSTPIGEVQLAEPSGNRLVAVLHVYTDTDSEFVALLDSGP